MHELLTPSEMTQADRLTIAAGTPGIVLMERAGRAIAEAVAARFPSSVPVAVVAGPGNNGGDGYVAARLLAERGYAVRLLAVGDHGKLKGDAAIAAGRWVGGVEAADPQALADAWVIVDALFGAGLDRNVEGAPRAMIEAMNAAAAPVIAVDLPSGINGATGAVMGAAVNAVETVTFFRRKPGHVLLPGRLHCGAVTVADIGIADAVLGEIRPQAFANEPQLWGARFPMPQISGHKYTRGHAVIVSGPMPTIGAARLAARGALRAGAGLVTIASPPDALAAHVAGNTAVMVRPAGDAAALSTLLADKRLNAVVLGPGGGVGETMRQQVLTALAGERAVVLDADALTSFADGPSTLISTIKARALPVILTPHEGEFRRLLKTVEAVHETAQSKCEQARRASSAFGAIVVLKGPDTVVAAPDGRAAIAQNAPPYLATAGAGDVLAGIAAGLLAQGMPGFEAAAAAVWLHGEAAREFGPGLISEDLPETLPRVYARLFSALS